MGKIILYGSDISYFTGKMENYFRVCGIFYEFRNMQFPAFKKEMEKKERKKKTLEREKKKKQENFEQNRAETIVIYHVHNERARLYVRKAQPLHVNES